MPLFVCTCQIDLSQYNIPENPETLPFNPYSSDTVHYSWVAPAPGGNAYAYSLFYVYYEQYQYIRGVALQVRSVEPWVPLPLSGVAYRLVMCVVSR